MKLLIDHWGLEYPKLVISVTGGANKFNLEPRLRQQFASGLVKVRRSFVLSSDKCRNPVPPI